MTTYLQPRILVVDDDRGITNALAAMLRKRLDARVETAEGIAEARSVLSEHDAFDVIVLDYQLPDGDGISLLESIKQNSDSPAIIMMTGEGSENTAADAFRKGAADYVPKNESASTSIVKAVERALVSSRLRAAEEALRASEERYRFLVENTADIVWITDMDLNMVYVSPSVEKIVGWTPEELVGRNVSEVAPFDQNHIASATLAREVQATSEGADPHRNLILELDWYHKDGSLVTTELNASLILDHQDQPVGIQGISRDITRRRKAEADLRASEDRLRTITTAASDAIIMLDQDGTVSFWNPAAERMLGYAAEEVIGRELHRLIASDPDYERYKVSFNRFKETGRSHVAKMPTEFECIRKDGKRVSVELTIAPWQSDGRWQSVGVIRDITERKKSEIAMQELNDRLERSVRQLEGVNQDLESFTYSVSHDLRAPLRAIRGFTEMLEQADDGIQTAEAVRLLGIIKQSVDHMSDLINDLLLLSRAGRQEMTLQDVDMGLLVSSIVTELRSLGELGSTSVMVDELPQCRGDQALLKHALSNIIRNAAKFSRMEPLPLIEIGSLDGHGEGKVAYYVKDNGAGFDMQYYDKLFAVFQRLHSSEEFEGTGVGLALTEKIVRRHGGKVWAEGEPGIGATFYFTLDEAVPTEAIRHQAHASQP